MVPGTDGGYRPGGLGGPVSHAAPTRKPDRIMQPSDVTIVIPALNEEKAIGRVVSALRERFPESELIVVDDGSTDGTARAAEEAGAAVIRHDRNRGYGAGLRSGTEAASRPYVLFCDADGQHSAEDVGRLIEACDGHDMVVGARNRESHAPLARKPGKAIMRRFADYLAGEKIPDLNSGLRIVKRDTLLRYIHLMPQGFSFSTTTTFAMLKTNRRVKWVPITVAKRVGTSTVKQWKHGPQTMMLLLRLTVLFEPLKVFLHVAAIMFGVSVVTAVVNLAISKGTQIGLTTVMFAMGSLIVFMFGLLCDQVSALRREIHE